MSITTRKSGPLSIEEARKEEAISALQVAEQVVSLGARSLARTDDDEGAYCANELSKVTHELLAAMKRISEASMD